MSKKVRKTKKPNKGERKRRKSVYLTEELQNEIFYISKLNKP